MMTLQLSAENHRARLVQRLQQVEDLLLDTKGRLPAHSVKPSIMMELLALEDEREQLLDALAHLEE